MLKRLLSLVLLAAVGLPIIAPALALGQDPDAALPACCRRNGQHHCAMSMDRMAALSRQSSQPQIGEVCSHYPRHDVAPVAGAHLIALHLNERAAAFFAALTPVMRAETQRRIARERSRHKRGPPPFLPARA